MSDQLMIVDADATSQRMICENPEEERLAESDTDSDYPSPRRSIQLSREAGSKHPTFEELVQNSVEKIINQ